MLFWCGVGMGRSSAFTRIVREAHLWAGLRRVKYPRWVGRKDLGLWKSHPEGCSGSIRVNAELWPFSRFSPHSLKMRLDRGGGCGRGLGMRDVMRFWYDVVVALDCWGAC